MSPITPIVSDFGPMAMLVTYLYLRDRRMAEAIIRLAEEQPDVDEEQIKEKLTVPIPNQLKAD